MNPSNIPPKLVGFANPSEISTTTGGTSTTATSSASSTLPSTSTVAPSSRVLFESPSSASQIPIDPTKGIQFSSQLLPTSTSRKSIGVLTAKAQASKVGELLFDDDYEILPYNSIFDWTVQDTLGYYKEYERYDLFHLEWGNDEMTANVIETLFDDREKYQILRRFPWPPRKKIFYSRGYYEDYEPRPTKGIKERPSEIKESKLKKSPAFRKTLHKLIMSVNLFDKKNKDADVPKAAGPSAPLRFLKDYATTIYDTLQLVLHDVPQGTKDQFMKRMFPKATAFIVPDHDTPGHYVAILKFDKEDDAAEAFQQSKIQKINGHPMNLVPLLRSKLPEMALLSSTIESSAGLEKATPEKPMAKKRFTLPQMEAQNTFARDLEQATHQRTAHDHYKLEEKETKREKPEKEVHYKDLKDKDYKEPHRHDKDKDRDKDKERHRHK